MHLGLNWLAQSLALSLTLNGLINCSYSSSSLNVLNGKIFENCANTILSKYPFISKKDLRKFNKILRESRLRNDHSKVTNGRDMQRLEKELSDLFTPDNPWRDSREEAYISAVQRCSLLATGNSENELLKELLSLDRYKRHLSSSRNRSKHKKRRHSKPTSKSIKESKVRRKRDVASFAFASSSATSQGSFQTGNPIESVIRSTLIGSDFFTRVFHPGLLQTNAKVIAQDITKAGLYGYNTAFVNDAVNAVTGALSFTTLSTNSENYAFLFAKAISEVIKSYELMSEANGNQIANNMIREIQRLLGDAPQVETPINVQQSNRGIETSKDSVLVPTSANNQRQNFPPIQPSPVMSHPENKVAIFRNKLMSLLAESKELTELFCQGSSPNIFQTVKTALSEYGLKVSVNAAVVATDAFMTLNSEQSCSQYANILSEVIRDVLFDNGLLESVKPEDIALKIVSSAKTFSNPSPSLPPAAPSSLPLLPSFPEVSTNKKEEFYESSGAVQKGFLNTPTQVPTSYQVREPTPAIKTSDIQATAFQSEPSRAVDAREKDQNPMPAIKPPPPQTAAFQSNPSNQRSVTVRDDAFAFVIKLDLKNTLSHSDHFASIFKPGIMPNDAANYASRIARTVFSIYDPAILLPADNQLREAIFKLPIGSQTSDYAEVFASVLTDILSKNGLIKNADSKYIGDSVINVLNKGTSEPKRITENPPILFEPKVSTSDSEPSFKSVEQLKKNVSLDSVDQSYATTPIDIYRYSDSQKLPNLSTRYEFVPTSTMAPQITTPENVPDYTQASEFVNAFMRAFEMFTSAPDPNFKSFSDAVVGDPSKLSGILEKEMESSVRALSQPESSIGEERDSKVLTSSKTTDRVDRKQTNTGKLEVQSESQSGARSNSTESGNAPVRVAATSSQSESVAKDPSAKLESSFTPTPVSSWKKEDSQKEEEERKSEILKKISSISTSGIAFIRSPNFNLKELCNTLNGFAETVGIEPLPYENCDEIPLIDYLLHVLREISSTSKKA